MAKTEGFGKAPIKNEGEATPNKNSEARKPGEFEYKMVKYHLSEAYRMAKRTDRLGYAKFSSEDLVDIKRLYENVFCEEMPEEN